jgi:hypothetical protein
VTPVLPQLRAEVVAAVAAPRRRARVPLVPVFAAAAVAVTVAFVLLALPGKPATDVTTPPAGSPPASQLLRYGILRRSPTLADREALRTLHAQMSPEDIPDLREDYVRAAGPDLILYSLPTDSPPMNMAYGGLRTDVLCLYVVPHGLNCWTDDQLAAGDSLVTGTRLVGLVPDGVASVTVRLDDGTDHSGRVQDNVYEIEVSAPRGVTPGVRGVIWRDAKGEFAGP